MNSRKGQTLLKGHTLLFEGDAFNAEGCVGYERRGVGRAKCSCGWLSNVFQNRAQRQRAHAQHKREIRDGGTT